MLALLSWQGTLYGLERARKTAFRWLKCRPRTVLITSDLLTSINNRNITLFELILQILHQLHLIRSFHSFVTYAIINISKRMRYFIKNNCWWGLKNNWNLSKNEGAWSSLSPVTAVSPVTTMSLVTTVSLKCLKSTNETPKNFTTIIQTQAVTIIYLHQHDNLS